MHPRALSDPTGTEVSRSTSTKKSSNRTSVAADHLGGPSLVSMEFSNSMGSEKHSAFGPQESGDGTAAFWCCYGILCSQLQEGSTCGYFAGQPQLYSQVILAYSPFGLHWPTIIGCPRLHASLVLDVKVRRRGTEHHAVSDGTLTRRDGRGSWIATPVGRLSGMEQSGLNESKLIWEGFW